MPSKLVDRYKPLFNDVRVKANLKIRAYLVRVLSDTGQVVREFHRLEELGVIHSYSRFYLDVDSIHRREGIPLGYYPEAILVSFVYEVTRSIIANEIPIFPNELQYEESGYVPSRVADNVKADKESLKKMGEDIETISFLHTVGLRQVAEDLLEALKRFYSLSDFEGSIKFFRKVVEALRNYVRNKNVTIVSDKRIKFLQEFLS